MAFQFGSQFTGNRKVAPPRLRDFGSNMTAGGAVVNTPQRGNIFQEQADISRNVKQARATAANPVVAQAPATDLTETATTPTATTGTTDYGDYTLEDIYNPAINQYTTEQERLQQELDDFKAAQESDLQKQYRLIEEEQRAIFDPRYEEATRAGEQAKETAQRGIAFSGFGRSSMATERQADLDRVVSQQRAALAAEQSAAIRLQRAAAEGASDAQLETLQNQVTIARDKRTELERELATKQAGLTEAQIKAGQQAESDKLDREIQALKDLGLATNPVTGDTLESLEAKKVRLANDIDKGKLKLSEREVAIKEGLAPLQKQKLKAEIAKLLSKSSGSGGGGAGSKELNLLDRTRANELLNAVTDPETIGQDIDVELAADLYIATGGTAPGFDRFLEDKGLTIEDNGDIVSDGGYWGWSKVVGKKYETEDGIVYETTLTE